MRIGKFIVVVLVAAFLNACGSSRNVSDSGSLKSLPTKKIISNHYQNNFGKETIYARINAKYKDGRTSVGFNIKMRFEKDKTIWMSATKLGIPVAKVKITPDRVTYYEKLQRTYFDGDFSLLSEWLGTDLDFEKVQNILLGQAVFDLKKGKYNAQVEGQTYQLSSKKNKDLYAILFMLNPDNFKLAKQEIRNDHKNQVFSVSYPNYKKIKGEQFPENINISALDDKHLTTISLEYKSIEFNKDLTFPFSIPNGYKEIRLE